MRNIVKLPPYKVKKVLSSLSQTMDWGIVQTNIPNTWKITRGEGITVVIIDTGCPVTKIDNKFKVHPDLDGAILLDKCKNFIPDEEFDDLKAGHGCHCCGVIGARNNDIGCVGVAPDCKIITLKGLNNNGVGDLKYIIKALEEVCVIKPDIVSMSLGTDENDADLHKAIKRVYDLNIPIIVAAGNGGIGSKVNYPAAYPECIAVGAYGKDGYLATFSSTGEEVSIVAPGVDIYSTYLNGGYCTMSGTSMATPWVTGICALLIAKHRKQELECGKNDCKTVEQIREHLQKYTVDKGILGRDDLYGYGLVDVNKLMEEPNIPYNPVPIKPFVKKKENIFQKFWKKIKGIF